MNPAEGPCREIALLVLPLQSRRPLPASISWQMAPSINHTVFGDEQTTWIGTSGPANTYAVKSLQWLCLSYLSKLHLSIREGDILLHPQLEWNVMARAKAY